MTLYYFEVELELLTDEFEVYNNEKIILKTLPHFDFQKTRRPHRPTSDTALQSQKKSLLTINHYE